MKRIKNTPNWVSFSKIWTGFTHKHHIYFLSSSLLCSQVALLVKTCLPIQETRDTDSIPGLGRSPGEGNSNPLQYSCLENSMDRGIWWATVHGVAKSWIWLKWLSTSLLAPNHELGKPWDTLSSVQFSHSVMSDSLQPHELQHTRPSCPSTTPRVHPNSCPSSRWCHPAISSSVVPFSSCPQSLPASESLPMSQLFAWGGQSIGVSALASVQPKNTLDWSPLEWIGWISLQSKGFSRAFYNTTVQKHQFLGAQLSSQSNFHIHTWLLEKP